MVIEHMGLSISKRPATGPAHKRWAGRTKPAFRVHPRMLAYLYEIAKRLQRDCYVHQPRTTYSPSFCCCWSLHCRSPITMGTGTRHRLHAAYELEHAVDQDRLGKSEDRVTEEGRSRYERGLWPMARRLWACSNGLRRSCRRRSTFGNLASASLCMCATSGRRRTWGR